MPPRPTTENGKSGLTIKCGEWLEKLVRAGAPLWYVKTHGGRYQRAGLPDFVLCVDQVFVGIEVKSPKEPAAPSPLQAHELGKIRAAGGVTSCVNSLEAMQTLVLQQLPIQWTVWISHT